MLRDRSLERVSGRLVMGPKAERKFGRRNFMELYAVFESPQAYQVVLAASQKPIGTLSQAFVDRLVPGASTFVLGGRGWLTLSIHHGGREIAVQPAPRGRKPTWGGFLPQFLSYEVCQAIREVIRGEVMPRVAHVSAQRAVEQSRERFSGVLSEAGWQDTDVDAEELRWWTFAGGRINNTLKLALQSQRADWKVLADNFAVKVRGAVTLNELKAALRQLEDPELWEDEGLWQTIATDLPNYRLSKFQSILPPWAEREMLAGHLLDIEGAWRVATGATGTLGLRVRVQPSDMPLSPLPEPTLRGHVPQRTITWVRDDASLATACLELRRQAFVALDVETTLHDQTLCLVQLGTPAGNLLVDPHAIDDLGPLAELLADRSVLKIIHNASFEARVLGRHGITIENVYDTLKVSRAQRGKQAAGHSLAAVCKRELAVELDKGPQVSDWRRRPLSKAQEQYAALDVEVLVDLYPLFRRGELL
jgi:ATP-dependent Lhr-like helicase